MLQLKNISKTYKNKVGEDTHALRSVSLTLEDTGMVFITGESGCGKSTLLNVLGGLDTYTSGTYLVEGRDFKRLSPRDVDAFRNTYLGFVFQEYNTLEHLTVKENIALSYELKGLNVNEAEIEKALSSVGLKNFLDRYPNEISIGQKQRVSIARALIKRPRILLADEPTAAIDKRASEQIWRLLKELSKTRLVIVTNHDHGVAERYADRIITLEDGRIIEDRDLKYEPQVIMSGNVLKIPAGGKLTEENFDHINNYAKDSLRKPTYVCLYRNKNDVAILNAPAVKKIEAIEKEKENEIPTREIKEKRSFDLVKSQMPKKNMARMAFSNLTMNKTKTAFTLVLTIVALIFFGMFCVLNNYNTYSAIVKASIKDNLSYMMISHTVEGIKDRKYIDAQFSDSNIKEIYKATGVITQGVYTVDWKVNFNSNTEYNIAGIVSVSSSTELDLIYGDVPAAGSSDVVISDYLANMLIINGGVSNMGVLTPVNDMEELVNTSGLKIKCEDGDIYLKVAGIYKTDYTFYDEIENIEQHEGYAQKYEFNKQNVYSLIYAPQNYIKNQASAMSRATDVSIFSKYDTTAITADSSIYKYEEYKHVKRIFPLATEQIVELGSREVVISLPVFNKLFVENEIDELHAFDFAGIDVDDYTTAFELLKSRTNAENFTISLQVLDDVNSTVEEYVVKGICVEDGEDMYMFNTNKFTSAIEASVFPVNRLIVSLNEYSEGELNTLGRFLDDNNMAYVSSNSDLIDDFYYRFSVFGGTFLTLSIFLALFAAVLIYNFISQGIVARKREIGVLRAMGAGVKDIVTTFLYEGLYIILSTFVVTTLLLFIIVQIVNAVVMASLEFSLVVLTINVWAVVGILLIDFVIVTISTLIPTIRYAKKQPIDIIQDKKNIIADNG